MTISRFEVGTIEFAACYAYAPFGRGAIARGSRMLRTRLKAADPAWMPRYAARVRTLAAESGRFARFFGPAVILVPVPGSRARAVRRPWVAERLALELLKQGLAQSVWRGLRRVRNVRKSATSLRGGRPSVADQLASLSAEPFRQAHGGADPGRQFLLVDDIVTKGRTLLAAAKTLREVCPAAEVRAFALARTLGHVASLEHLVVPCEGTIRWVGDDAWRAP